MNRDQDAQRLHDRATRGEALTAEEQRALAHWYDQQDRAEAALLASPSTTPNDATLQHQVQATLDQLSIVTTHVQTLSAENAALRRENAALRTRLAHRSASPTA